MSDWRKIFGIIWTGQFFSILTSSMVNFAVIIWLSMETGSAEMLAWGAIAALLPQCIIGPFSGVLIDRWNRRKTMMAADAFIAICTLLLAALFWTGSVHLWHIFLLLCLRSIGSAFHSPAMQAAVPMLAPQEQLTRIAGINQIITSVSQIAGPALGAMLATIWKMEYVLMIDVAGALIAVSSLAFIRIPDPEKSAAKAKNILHEMKEGAMEILNNKGLSLVFLYSMLAILFIMPVGTLFPLMTLNHFNGTPTQAGFIEAIWSVGALAGGIVMGARIYKANRVILINWMYLVCGATFLLSGLLPSEGGFVWFAVLTIIAGVSGAIYSSAFTALVQNNVDPAALGRVFSLFYTVSLMPPIVGLTGIGFIADSVGLSISFVGAGAMIMIVGVVAFLTPSAARVDAAGG